MHRGIGSILLVLAALSVAAPALAESGRQQKPQRAWVQEAPVKDCTRLNARFGYYGNPWCTPAEQERWDRWDASRTVR